MLSPSGYKIEKPLNGLEPVVQAWITIVSDCCVTIPQAGNFWSNERQFCALLCAAAWRANALGLTEVKTRRAEAGNGHADLLLVTDGTDRLAIEAKFKWISTSAHIAQASSKLQEAHREAAALPPELAQHRLGVLFAACWINNSATLGALFRQLHNTFRSMDVLAWSIAAGSEGTFHCPGVFLIGRMV